MKRRILTGNASCVWGVMALCAFLPEPSAASQPAAQASEVPVLPPLPENGEEIPSQDITDDDNLPRVNADEIVERVREWQKRQPGYNEPVQQGWYGRLLDYLEVRDTSELVDKAEQYATDYAVRRLDDTIPGAGRLGARLLGVQDKDKGKEDGGRMSSASQPATESEEEMRRRLTASEDLNAAMSHKLRAQEAARAARQPEGAQGTATQNTAQQPESPAPAPPVPSDTVLPTSGEKKGWAERGLDLLNAAGEQMLNGAEPSALSAVLKSELSSALDELLPVYTEKYKQEGRAYAQELGDIVAERVLASPKIRDAIWSIQVLCWAVIIYLTLVTLLICGLVWGIGRRQARLVKMMRELLERGADKLPPIR